MKSLLPISLFFIAQLILISCQKPERSDYPEHYTITLSNNSDAPEHDVLAFIPLSDIMSRHANFNSQSFIIVDREAEIANQISNTTDSKGIHFVLDSLTANESRVITVYYNPVGKTEHRYTKRTQAELSNKIGGEWKNREYIGGHFINTDHLSVPPEHKDHSWFLRYEGPGWESDKVGYRFYLDQRNATDVFGKTTSEMVLQNVGQDGFDSYHELQPWGMDVMKVGKSLGIGSPGILYDTIATRIEKTDSVVCTISNNGVVYSSIITDYYGWNTGREKLTLHCTTSIAAGTRLTHYEINSESPMPALCTGVVKDSKAKLITSEGSSNSFGYIATYGAQSLNGDNLGIAVFFKSTDFNSFKADGFSHIVEFKPGQKLLDYYFAGVWQLEPNGITTEEQFRRYLEKTAQELAQPVNLTIN